MRGSRKFCQRGLNFDKKFLEGETIQANTTISGPSRACRKWLKIKCWLHSFVIFRRSGPVLLRTPIFLLILGGSGPPVPPLDLPMALDPLVIHKTTQPEFGVGPSINGVSLAGRWWPALVIIEYIVFLTNTVPSLFREMIVL